MLHLFSPYSYQSARGHKIAGCRTDARKFFFALRVIHPWNNLKLTPASMSSLCRFKALFRNADLSGFFKQSLFVHHTADRYKQTDRQTDRQTKYNLQIQLIQN